MHFKRIDYKLIVIKCKLREILNELFDKMYLAIQYYFTITFDYLENERRPFVTALLL